MEEGKKKRALRKEETVDSYRGQRSERKRRGGKEIEVSTAVSVLLCYKKEGLHTLNMRQRTAPQIVARSQVQQNSYFQDSGEPTAL